MRCDVVVVGAGLAGLSAARDLAAAGTDVVAVEARGRAGGTGRADAAARRAPGAARRRAGAATSISAYRGLVDELGLTLVPAFGAETGPGSGDEVALLAEGRVVGTDWPWFDDADRASYDAAEAGVRQARRRASTPTTRWSHPDADRLDRISVGTWMRSVGATRNAVRARELAMLALSAESVERTSLLSDLRKEAAAGASGFYGYGAWESAMVEEGSATVALTNGGRARRPDPLRDPGDRDPRSPRAAARWRPRAASASTAARWSSAVPVGPLRRIAIDGVSAERLDLAGPPAPRARREGLLLLSRLVLGGGGAERHRLYGDDDDRRHLAAATGDRVDADPARAPGGVPDHLAADGRGGATGELVAAFGDGAANPLTVHIRRWGVDPWTLGYITGWRPGDVMAVGPLHGTHEPPFYVCGSDQWVCGYMEGAVRTGRAAAKSALGDAG